MSQGKNHDEQIAATRRYPTAITGTWTDVERRAWYVYENIDRDTTDWELAEAVLVMLGEDWRGRANGGEHGKP